MLKKFKRAENKGVFLITALILSLILFILAGILHSFVVFQTKQLRNNIYLTQADYAGLAGIKHAAGKLANIVPILNAQNLPTPDQYTFDFILPVKENIQAIVKVLCALQSAGGPLVDPFDGTVYTYKYKVTSKASLCRGRVLSGNFIPDVTIGQSVQSAVIWTIPAKKSVPDGAANPGRSKIVYSYDEYK